MFCGGDKAVGPQSRYTFVFTAGILIIGACGGGGISAADAAANDCGDHTAGFYFGAEVSSAGEFHYAGGGCGDGRKITAGVQDYA